jgi:hypothetical protein
MMKLVGLQPREFLFPNEGRLLENRQNTVGRKWATILHELINDGYQWS